MIATRKYNIPMGAAMIKDDQDDLGPATVIRGVIQSWELEVSGRDNVLLMSQSDMACLEIMICSRTGTVTSRLYPGNHFEIARHPDGMLMMRIDRLTSEMAEDSGCFRLSKLTTDSVRPRPAIYDEEGQLVNSREENRPTHQSKWDRPGIESDSDTEYSRYMRSSEERFDPKTEKKFTLWRCELSTIRLKNTRQGYSLKNTGSN